MYADIARFDYDDELIEATRRDGSPRVSVYRLRGRAAVLGRGSDPEEELNLDACRRDGIPLLRRRGGGCAVVLDPGTVVVSVVLATEGIRGSRQYLAGLTAWLAAGLERLGVEGLRREGLSDLAVGERKIAGSCLYRTRDFLLYGASVLVAPDVELMERYLRHPPREPAYRRGRSHAAFVGRLTGDGWDVTADWAAGGLRRTLLPQTLPVVPRSRNTGIPKGRAPEAAG